MGYFEKTKHSAMGRSFRIRRGGFSMKTKRIIKLHSAKFRRRQGKIDILEGLQSYLNSNVSENTTNIDSPKKTDHKKQIIKKIIKKHGL